MEAWGPHGNGAYCLEPTRTGPTEGAARGRAKAFDAVASHAATAVNRPSSAQIAPSQHKSGDGALVHGLRGRPSNRKLAASLEQKILARVRQRYADFGPTLAAVHLAGEGLLVPAGQGDPCVARTPRQFRRIGDAG